MLVKFDYPHCTNEDYISLSDNEEIGVKDRDKLISYLYDHIEVNDIFFAEELINEILKILSKIGIKELNLHTILVDMFGIVDSCCQEGVASICVTKCKVIDERSEY
ncbi:MAG: hypothetical protein EHM20_08740 [Alphaproteobacteria bacterium]|nr:MAG: hypothetical protein EHM20_08740 [Alphaproteobacteria bacterium]